MIAQSNMMDLLSNLQQQASGKAVQKSGAGTSSQFKDVFADIVGKSGNAAGKADSIKNPAVPYKSSTTEMKSNGQARNFKEVLADMKNAANADEKAVKAPSGNCASDDETGKAAESEGKKQKTDAVVNAVAQILGISSEELMKMLNTFEIDADDLADSSKSSEIAAKIAGLTGLNGEQGNALAQIIAETCASVDEILAQENVPDKQCSIDSKLMTDQLEFQEDGGSSGDTVKNAEFSDIIARFRAKISQITEKLEQNPQAVSESIDESVRKYLDGNLNNLQSNTLQADAGQKKDSTGESPKDEKVNTEVSSDAGKAAQKDEKKSGSKDGEADSGSYAESLNKAEAAENLQTGQNTGTDDTLEINVQLNGQIGKSDSAGEITPAVLKDTVDRSQIINQVVEKAKVVLDGDKSEMVMDLKPDSLGKLSLKVVTEHGMVIAKFVAESQQVRQVLEANMQVLKDSLEKQGMSVQGFSVSVRQDSTGGNGRDESGRYSGMKKTGFRRSDGIKTAAAFGGGMAANPYELNESSINLTA